MSLTLTGTDSVPVVVTDDRSGTWDFHQEISLHVSRYDGAMPSGCRFPVVRLSLDGGDDWIEVELSPDAVTALVEALGGAA